MIYAPVLIPTLNRYEHFRECLNSLEECTGADKTDVYVALDYPPNEKYLEGWKKIDEFLSKKEANNKFGKLVVIRREHNYGIMHSDSNVADLIRRVKKMYDRCILSEDDNVFSHNFLEYINKGLDRYKNDTTIFAICGYNQPYDFKFSDNNFFRHNTDFSAWGYGFFFERLNKVYLDIRNGYLRETFSISNMKKVKKHGYNRLCQYIIYSYKYKKDYMPITDCVITCYLIVKDMQVICPALSKTRNIGWDETGNSFTNAKILKKYGDIPQRHKTQVIDSDTTFDFEGDEWAYYDYNNELTAEVSEGKMSLFEFLGVITVFFIKLLGKEMGLNPIARKIKSLFCHI